MAPPIKDLTGRKFGRLTVASLIGRRKKRTYWACMCECGQTTEVSGGNLSSGQVSSCGCLRKEVLDRTSHGLSGTREYNIWKNMIDRCTNPDSQQFHHYGGRGIKVCDAWLDVSTFYADMGPCPEGMTLGRRDNDGGYNLGNCRWETDEEQANNKRTTRLIEHNGKVQSMSQWARELGLPVETLFARLKKLAPEQALVGRQK